MPWVEPPVALLPYVPVPCVAPPVAAAFVVELRLMPAGSGAAL
jgi:hypothetical protein